MRNAWKFLLIFLWSPVFLFSQTLQPLSGDDFPEAIVTHPLTYDQESIWDYLNSGEDLYLEYGFILMMEQEVIWENEKVRVEVYQMGSPEEAFGIYSLSVIKCQMRDTLSRFDCSSAFQYQAAYGDLYILITCESNPESARQHFFPVALALMKKNQRQGFDLPDPFNLPEIKKGSSNLAFIQGPIGLQNCMFPFQDLFLRIRFRMYATLLTQSDLDIYFSQIAFQTPDDQLLFLGCAGLMKGNMPIPNTNNNDGLYREYKQLDAQTIYFLQSQEPYPIDMLINPGN
ncbi:MAG: hypothetical protein M0P58_04005 [Bacteroidales bacterium]|jgi:hypothetical protein|nr:hypothetical protein [Bacteroidales bacterium]